jgi:hypothetical protein
MTSRSAEIVVGGGAIGSSIAYQHAPVTGRQVAEWLLDGQPSLDLSPLSFARFAGTDTTARGSLVSGVD